MLDKSNRNFKTAQWAEQEKYYDVAVSRYYYALYQKIILILSKKESTKFNHGNENSHKDTINYFIEIITDELEPLEKAWILKLHELRRFRNAADYSSDKINENIFIKNFKSFYVFLKEILDKY